MIKHTPGPWFARPNVLQVTDKKIWFDSDGSRHGETPNMIIDCESVADTFLIASAPELLEALEDILASLSGGEKSCGHEFECVCSGDKARAAIRRAKGEQE